MKRVALLSLVLVTLFAFTAVGNSVCCCVEAFFVSPSVDGVIESEIIKALNKAEKTIDIAMYSFTDDELAAAVIEAYNREVEVRVMLEDGRRNEQGGEYDFLHDSGVSVKLATGGRLFHHKFVVLDERLVITGSYNWSDNADDDNFENVVLISCEQIAEVYLKEFEEIWNTLESE